uniref:Longitudinals lacking protein, isoforms A/B/D/L n=1 Tax=Schizaphis graminum TaxID=13262 RepID=A0A2S2NGF4_SCHGA
MPEEFYMLVNYLANKVVIILIFFSGLHLHNTTSVLNNSEDVYICPQNCGKTYKYYSSLYKHLKYECNKTPQLKCLFCDKMVKRPDNLKNHMLIVHKYISKSKNNN